MQFFKFAAQKKGVGLQSYFSFFRLFRFFQFSFQDNHAMLSLSILVLFAVSVTAHDILGVNLALNKPANQSSDYGPWKADHAVNGNKDANMVKDEKACTHTDRENSPWWAVKLGDVYPVSKIVIYNREDCCGDRLIGAVVSVIDTTGPDVTDMIRRTVVGQVTKENYSNNPIVITTQAPVYGNVVNILLHGKTEYLTLCEVEVYADLPLCSAIPENLVIGKIAYQTTAANDNKPSAAIDGITGSCIQTKVEQFTPLWSVYLGGMYRVKKITIYADEGCCDGAIVRVNDVDITKFGAGTKRLEQIGSITEENMNEKPIVFELAKPISGNVVSVNLETGALALCEVKVEVDCKQENEEREHLLQEDSREFWLKFKEYFQN